LGHVYFIQLYMCCGQLVTQGGIVVEMSGIIKVLKHESYQYK